MAIITLISNIICWHVTCDLQGVNVALACIRAKPDEPLCPVGLELRAEIEEITAENMFTKITYMYITVNIRYPFNFVLMKTPN